MGIWIRNRFRVVNVHRDQEAQSRQRWGQVSLRSPLGAAHARRRTLAAGILPSACSVLTRFAILASLVSKRRLSGTGSPSLRLSQSHRLVTRTSSLRAMLWNV